MEIQALRGRKHVEYIRRKGKTWRGKHMKVIYLPQEDPVCKVGTAVSSKISKSAVKRNRMRRRCREALRVSAKADKRNLPFRLILMPRRSSLECDFEELKSDVEHLLDFLSE